MRGTPRVLSLLGLALAVGCSERATRTVAGFWVELLPNGDYTELTLNERNDVILADLVRFRFGGRVRSKARTASRHTGANRDGVVSVDFGRGQTILAFDPESDRLVIPEVGEFTRAEPEIEPSQLIGRWRYRQVPEDPESWGTIEYLDDGTATGNSPDPPPGIERDEDNPSNFVLYWRVTPGGYLMEWDEEGVNDVPTVQNSMLLRRVGPAGDRLVQIGRAGDPPQIFYLEHLP